MNVTQDMLVSATSKVNISYDFLVHKLRKKSRQSDGIVALVKKAIPSEYETHAHEYIFESQ